MTQNEFNEIIEMYKNGKGYIKIAKETGINLKTVQARILRWKLENGIKKGTLAKDINMCKKEENTHSAEKQTHTIEKDGSQTSSILLKLDSNQLKDPNYVISAHGFDPEKWEIIACINNLWQMGYKDNNGVESKDLYQSKITVRPKKNHATLEILKAIENYSPKNTYTFKRHLKQETLLEVPFMDLHIGKFSWAPETNDNLDHKIIQTRFYKAVDKILDIANKNKPTQILVPIGQDLVNIDNIEGNTTKGTRQDNDIRFTKMIDIATKTMIDLITSFEGIAPVDILYVPGNHSQATEYCICKILEAYFRSSKNIIFDTRPIRRKYYRYFNSLIGFSHGDTEKNKIRTLMQIEAKKEWSETEYHEWHMGHLHSEQTFGTEEKYGIISRNISSITGTDAWHYNSGYVGAVKKAQVFLWDKTDGLTDIKNILVKD